MKSPALLVRFGFVALAQLACAVAAHLDQANVLNSLPLRFEANSGQANRNIQFLSRGPRFELLLARDGSSLKLTDGKHAVAVTTRLRHAREPQLEGLDLLSSSTNYFQGNDASRWLSGIRSYRRVQYRSVYDGVDLVFHGSNQSLEYDFLVAPGAKVSQIELEISRNAALRLDQQGNLVLQTAAGDVRWNKPVAYQEEHGEKRLLPARFTLRRNNRVAFEIGRYDHSKPLIIDPTLSYSTYLGGANNDGATRIAVDSSGNIYVVGATNSANLPFTAGSYQPAYKGGSGSFTITGDVFVTKIDPTGTKVIYNTYLGGSLDDVGLGIAVDAAGNAYVTGYTTSGDFPNVNAFQKAFAGPTSYSQGSPNNFHPGGDAFIAKLNPAGNQLLFSTFLGGMSDDRGTAITLDPNGNIYVAGTTLSTNFPFSQDAYQKVMRGGGGNPLFCDGCGPNITFGDAFVAKFSADGSQRLWATYLGGGQDDTAMSIVADRDGSAWVGGFTLSKDFPLSAKPFQSNYGGANSNQAIYNFGDGFIAHLSSDGSSLLYSTFFGGSSDDAVGGIPVGGMAMDSSGALYVTGFTSSPDFPHTSGSYNGPASDPTTLLGDAFVAKFDFSQSNPLVFSIFLGGSNDDAGAGIAVDGAGNIFVTGSTGSPNFPLVNPTQNQFLIAPGGGNNSTSHAFLTELDPTGKQILFSTFLGGSNSDMAYGIALDSAGSVYICGVTDSPNFPIQGGPLQKTFGGDEAINGPMGDAFIAKFTGFAAAGPLINTGGIVNGGSFVAGQPIGPGAFVSIFGSNLSSESLSAPSIPLATKLDNVSVKVNGEAAALYFVSSKQVNFQAPWDLNTSGPATVVLTNNSASATAAVSTAQFSPAVLSDGSGHAIAINLDGTLAAAHGAIPGLSTHPVARGDTVQVYATGLGPVNQPVPTGGIPPSGVFAHTKTKPVVLVGGTAIPSGDLLFSGLTPQFVGVNQVNITIPPDAPTGNSIPLQFQIGGITTPASVTIAIQ